jgi:hypothetical protein
MHRPSRRWRLRRPSNIEIVVVLRWVLSVVLSIARVAVIVIIIKKEVGRLPGGIMQFFSGGGNTTTGSNLNHSSQNNDGYDRNNAGVTTTLRSASNGRDTRPSSTTRLRSPSPNKLVVNKSPSKRQQLQQMLHCQSPTQTLASF